MATSYYYESQGSKGILAISVNVFQTVAQNALDEALNSSLKGKVTQTSDKKKGKLVITIIEKKVNVTVEVFALQREKLDECFAELQKEIYEAIYDATEISDVKVNISLLGFAK